MGQVSAEIVLRGKKMVGALGRVPLPKELRERLENKGATITLGEARSLSANLAKWWKERSGETTPASQPRQKTTSSYGH